MSDEISADQIEREIEVERAALARSLNALQRQVAPDAIIEKVSKMLLDNGGDFAGTAARQVRENPLALAVTGAGLAWLISGPSKRPAPKTQHQMSRPSVDYDDRAYATAPGFRDTPPDESFEARVARAEGTTYDPTVKPSAMPDTRADATPEAQGRSLRDRLMEGTEMMTDVARDRVIAAREAAILAERRIEARAREYGTASKDAFYSQPLMGALVAFGVGALAGALLPRTRTEDRHFGPARDRAMMEAERIYQAEAAKLRAQAEVLAEEALSSTKSALQDADPKKAEAGDGKSHPIN